MGVQILVEDLARLFGPSLLEVVVVRRDCRTVSSISWNNTGLLFDGHLSTHIVTGGAVDIVIRPLEELIFDDLFTSLVVAHLELRFRIQECALLCHFCNFLI